MDVLREEESAIVTNEHNYFLHPSKATAENLERLGQPQSYEDSSDRTDSASETQDQPKQIPTLPPFVCMDHNYVLPFHPDISTQPQEIDQMNSDMSPVKLGRKRKEYKKRTPKLKDVTNIQGGSRELKNLFEPVKPKYIKPIRPQYKARTLQEETQNLYSILFNGVDREDIDLIQKSYERLLASDQPNTYWLNDTHWMTHPCTVISDPKPPPAKRKRNQSLSGKCQLRETESNIFNGEGIIIFL